MLKKINYDRTTLTERKVEIIERAYARRLRTFLQEKVRNQRSVVNKDVNRIASVATMMMTTPKPLPNRLRERLVIY